MNAALWLLLFRGGSAVVTPGIDGPYWIDKREVYVGGAAATEVVIGGVMANEVKQ